MSHSQSPSAASVFSPIIEHAQIMEDFDSDRSSQYPEKPTYKGLKKSNRFLLALQQWYWEIGCYFLSVVCVGGLIALLVLYGDRPLDQWHHSISVNSLIAILTTFLFEFLKEPIGSAMAQMKYNHFHHNKHPLTDFSHLDEASKSPFQSLKLLGRIAFWKRYWLLPVLGAALTIVIVAVGPFVQQIVALPERWVADNGRGHPTIPVVQNFSVNSTGPLSNPLSAAQSLEFLPRSGVLGGLYGGATDFDLFHSCSSVHNCTWPLYHSIMMCNSCKDLSRNLTISTPANGGQQVGMLPNGHRLDGGAQFNMSSSVSSLAFPDAANVLVDFSIINQTPNGSYQAYECILQICLQTLTAQSYAVSIDPYLAQVRETLNSTNVADTTSMKYNYWSTVVNNTMPIPGWINGSAYTPSTWNDSFQISTNDAYVLSAWLTRFFNGTVTKDQISTNDQSLLLARVVGGAFPTTNTIQTLSNMTANLNNVLRQSYSRNQQVQGFRRRQANIIHVEWGWIALPLALITLSLLVMLTTMWYTYAHDIPAWRADILPVLFNGLDENMRTQNNLVTSTEAMHNAAKSQSVTLQWSNEVPSKLIFVQRN